MVSEAWLQGYISDLYASCSDNLYAAFPNQSYIDEYLEDKFEEYIYTIAPLKNTCPSEFTTSWANIETFEPYLGIDFEHLCYQKRL